MASRVCMRALARVGERARELDFLQRFNEVDTNGGKQQCDIVFREYSRNSERVGLHSGGNCSLLNALLLSDASVSARRVPPSERALGRTGQGVNA